jgi:hypothetical protein
MSSILIILYINLLKMGQGERNISRVRNKQML